MGFYTTSSLIDYRDDEIEYEIAEAIEQFAQCNIRFRSPNRTAAPVRQKKPAATEPRDAD